jgi:hypothetical protein
VLASRRLRRMARASRHAAVPLAALLAVLVIVRWASIS